ncbi:shikimate kinase [Pedobacter xixiisoli]|uniref:Shikimate kinase n=1 Tax=Pedobacter xixiisoli TaxID=1476464 RepID=A0A285ZZJ1_9SPHI|nr:shikimate kinase [Pedobacter xixiisoli]SOD15041.1 shikimate kinase [Pedobacter xixiisoli]
MIVFLVGFMGCGKSTKAKQLANLLECPVIDIDAVIVEQQEMSIADYFAANGEGAFRQLENEMLKSFDYPETCVVATGGGLPCFLDNMEWMNENGVTVYLEMTPPQLVSRLHNREKRPLIKGMDDEQLLAFIIDKLEERNVFYRQSKVVINSFDLDAKALLEELETLT